VGIAGVVLVGDLFQLLVEVEPKAVWAYYQSFLVVALTLLLSKGKKSTT